MQVALKQDVSALEKRLIFFFFEPTRGGYTILDHDDEEMFCFTGDVKEAAKIRMEKVLLWLSGHSFHLYESFAVRGVEYHPVLLEFGDGYVHDTAVLHKKGFDFVPLLQHPVGEHVRRARHKIPVRF